MAGSNSKRLFSEAKQYIPGGVNSPVRAFKSVGRDPLFITRAKGAWMWDADDIAYLDLINSWGPMILGHAQPEVTEAVKAAVEGSLSFGAPSEAEIRMAELITEMVPSIEKVRMVNSGTEATMSAIRLARGYTGRDKIIKFEGCYHGHGDSFLIAAGSGALTFGTPDSKGVTKGVAADTLTAKYNDFESVKALTDANPDAIAAIILEPVPGNMGLILPEAGFLEDLRSLCDREGILLIFDEVMTGFRLAPGGAQEVFGVRPDLTTLGKIIGGGMPVGAYGGKKEIMDFVSPEGPVYQAGTLSGNPVAMAAGLATLGHLRRNPEIYEELNRLGETFAGILKSAAEAAGVPHRVHQLGSMFCIFFTSHEVKGLESAKTADTNFFASFFRKMLENNVYLPPSQFESAFLSAATDAEGITCFEAAVSASMK